MKIAFIPSTYFPFIGGMEVQTHNLANELVKKKNEVDIILFKKLNIKSKYQIAYFNTILVNFIYYFKYYLSINLDFIMTLYLKDKIKKYDLLHFQSLNYKTLIILNSAKNNGAKILVTFHGADIQINKKIGYGYRLDRKYDLYLKNSIKNIDCIQSISKTITKDLIKLKVKKSKIFYLPNAIDYQKIISTKYTHNDKKILKLLIVARYAELKKGFDKVLPLTKKLIKLNVNFIWLIAGNKTEKLLKNSYINKNKKYFKFFSEIKNKSEYNFPPKKLIEIYKKSDLYINLARIESFGVTMLEAMSCGVPVITYDTKGGNEIVINNYNGFLIKKNNIKVLAEKIKAVSRSKKISILKVNCKKFASRFDIKKITKDLINQYKKISN